MNVTMCSRALTVAGLRRARTLVLFAALTGAVAVICSPAAGQGISGHRVGSPTPIVGSSDRRNVTTDHVMRPSANPELYRQRDSSGRPCVTVGAYGRPYVSNPNLYDHVVFAVNACSRRISLEVCYFKSRSCITIDVPGNQRKESILGIQPATKDFKFEYIEKS